MSHPTVPPESPGTAVPGTAPATNPAPTPSAAPSAPMSPMSPVPPDVSRQIAELTDAVNRLVQAQQTLPAPPRPAPVDIAGDIPGGVALLPAVDTSKLSPLQQITLGLRDAKPVGPGAPEVLRSRKAPPPESSEPADAGPAGAD